MIAGELLRLQQENQVFDGSYRRTGWAMVQKRAFFVYLTAQKLYIRTSSSAFAMTYRVSPPSPERFKARLIALELISFSCLCLL
jgi:hypothetical protein